MISFDETAAEKTDGTDTEIITTIPEKKDKVIDIQSESMIDDDSETILARDFVRDFTLSILERDEDRIDLDKYIDNEYLKEYVKENIKARCNNSQWYTDYEKYMDKGWILSVVVCEKNVKNDINYYTLSCYFNGESNSGGWGNHRPCVGIRDGRIVNFNDWHFMESYANFWDDDVSQDMVYHSYYLYLYSNPWDNEKVAERAVKAYKKYIDKEYESYSDAWNSLGE